VFFFFRFFSFSLLQSDLRPRCATAVRARGRLSTRKVDFRATAGSFWARQRSAKARPSQRQVQSPEGSITRRVSVFRYDDAGPFRDASSQGSGARTRILASGEARIIRGRSAAELDTYRTQDQPHSGAGRESLAIIPRTVPFGKLSSSIRLAENAGLAAAATMAILQFWHSTFLFASLVFIAAAVRLRFFRFGECSDGLSGLEGEFWLCAGQGRGD